MWYAQVPQVPAALTSSNGELEPGIMNQINPPPQLCYAKLFFFFLININRNETKTQK